MFKDKLEFIEELQETLALLSYKCWYYETAQAAGTGIHLSCEPHILHICHGPSFNANRFSSSQPDLHQRTIIVSQDLISHLSLLYKTTKPICFTIIPYHFGQSHRISQKKLYKKPWDYAKKAAARSAAFRLRAAACIMFSAGIRFDMPRIPDRGRRLPVPLQSAEAGCTSPHARSGTAHRS